MFSTAAYYFFFATIIAVVFFSDSLQNKITIALLFVIMNYACKTAMTGIALAWGEQTLPRELINYRIVMDPWSQMMACILFGYRSFIFILQYFCFLHQSVFSTFWKKIFFWICPEKSHR